MKNMQAPRSNNEQNTADCDDVPLQEDIAKMMIASAATVVKPHPTTTAAGDNVVKPSETTTNVKNNSQLVKKKSVKKGWVREGSVREGTWGSGSYRASTSSRGGWATSSTTRRPSQGRTWSERLKPRHASGDVLVDASSQV